MDFILYTKCVIFFVVLVFISRIESGGKEGLIFDRITSSLIQLPHDITEDVKCGAWAIACPASQLFEDKLEKNALIVKKICNVGSKAAELDIKPCEETYRLALQFDLTKEIFRFGFAIYHIDYFPRFKFPHFMRPKQITEFMQKHSMFKGNVLDFEAFKLMYDAQNAVPNNEDELWVSNDHRMEFTWITMFNLGWNFFNKILKRLIYKIDLNNKWPIGERCEDYSLGSEVYQETNVEYVDKLYSKENQNKIFGNIKMPQKKSDPVPGQVPTKTQCDLHKICLSKWSLIPMDQFTFGSSTSSSMCSNLTTIPIWTDAVENVLKKVDQYLYSLHRVIGKALVITSGITGDVLELPLAKSRWNRSSKIYLDPEKRKIPVPEIIFKIISYVGSNLYSAIVVIHNSPNYNGRRICSKLITNKGGWQEITKDSNGRDFGNVYVCNDDELVFRLLGRTKEKKRSPWLDLSLLSFPSPGKGDKSTRNIKEDVDKEFKTFSERGADQHPRDGILERREEFVVSDEVDEQDGQGIQID